MTFFSISKKMIIAHMRNYRIFLGGNLFAITLFFVFASIFTNQSFFDPTNVNSIISSNIYFASILAGLFLVIFLPISSQVFWTARKRDYGVLSVLGMGSRQILARISLEYVLISTLALGGALIIGTLISGLFHVTMVYYIGITGITWIQGAKPYILTIGLYLCEVLIVLAWNALLFLKVQLVQLLRREKKMGKKALWMKWLEHHYPKVWYSNLVKWIPFVGHRGLWRARNLIGVFLIAGSLWLAGICISLYPSIKQTVDSYSPYDMVFCNAFGKNRVEEEKITTILKEHDVSIRSKEKANFLRDGAFNILSASQAKALSNRNYCIKPGEFVMVFQVDLKDGYEHNMICPEEITLGEKKSFHFAKKDIHIFWNPNPMFADNTVVISDADFITLGKTKSSCWPGTVYLYRFNEWKKSHDAIFAVNQYLQEINKLDHAGQFVYRATSHMEQYEDGIKSEQFLVLVMGWLIVLLFTAAMVILHLGLQSEQEEMRRAACSLNGLGISDGDLSKMTHFRSAVRYYTPLIGGILLGACLVFWWNKSVFVSNAFAILEDVLVATVMLATGYCLVYKSNKNLLLQIKQQSERKKNE